MKILVTFCVFDIDKIASSLSCAIFPISFTHSENVHTKSLFLTHVLEGYLTMKKGYLTMKIFPIKLYANHI